MTKWDSSMRRRHPLWGEDKAAPRQPWRGGAIREILSDCFRYNRPGPFDKSIVLRAAVSTGISGIGSVGEQPGGAAATGSIVMSRTRGTSGTIVTAFHLRGPGVLRGANVCESRSPLPASNLRAFAKGVSRGLRLPVLTKAPSGSPRTAPILPRCADLGDSRERRGFARLCRRRQAGLYGICRAYAFCWHKDMKRSR